MNAHDLFTIRRLAALRDTLESIARDMSLNEVVRLAALAAWETLSAQLEALEKP